MIFTQDELLSMRQITEEKLSEVERNLNESNFAFEGVEEAQVESMLKGDKETYERILNKISEAMKEAK